MPGHVILRTVSKPDRRAVQTQYAGSTASKKYWTACHGPQGGCQICSLVRAGRAGLAAEYGTTEMSISFATEFAMRSDGEAFTVMLSMGPNSFPWYEFCSPSGEEPYSQIGNWTSRVLASWAEDAWDELCIRLARGWAANGNGEVEQNLHLCTARYRLPQAFPLDLQSGHHHGVSTWRSYSANSW